MKNTHILLLIMFLVTCGSPKEDANKTEDALKSQKSEIQGDTIIAQPSVIQKLDSLKSNVNEYEQTIINKILNNIHKYSGKPLIEKILTIGNLDGQDPIDTITSTIWVDNDIVHLKSEWTRNNKVIWKQKLVNPYLYLSSNSMYDFESSPIWTRFTIAKDYAVPTISIKSNYDNISKDFIINTGSNELGISKKEYLKYLNEFKGELLLIDEPELSKLSIWYEPEEKFVTYYQP